VLAVSSIFGSFQMNMIRKIGLGAAGAVASVGAFAQEVGGAFDTALATVTANVTSYAGALVGLAAVGVAFMVAIKYVKKIRGAA
jgi:hypothetical protein